MIAFKEWELVCDALAAGKQSLIFRKGGIHEGRAGFSFREEPFLLFPTRFHAQGEQLKVTDYQVKPEWQTGDSFQITHWAQAEWAITLEQWEQVLTLQHEHLWTDACLKARFDWEGKGMHAGSIHCAFLRVHQLETPIQVEYSTKLGGCRSWVEIPTPDSFQLIGSCVLSDQDHLARDARYRQLLGPALSINPA